MSSSSHDAVTGLSLYLESLKVQESISISDKLIAVTDSSNIKLEKVEVLKSFEGYNLWSHNMLVIFEAMRIAQIVLLAIDLSLFVSAAELITFHLPQ
jgi:uncharacterized protein YpbB